VIARRTSVTEADVERFFESISSITKAPPAALAGYKGMVSGFVANPQIDTALWATKQTYIALGFLLETAALLGVDACPMEGFNPAAFDEILGLPALGYNATVTCALGYRSPNDKHANDPKVRYPATEVVLHV
jgi:nitroreductase